ncbi:hypothetical protein L7F22_024181 [Adiantum nelumboides]|nr:hypothetical protein [Adiantum nelumboides]
MGALHEWDSKISLRIHEWGLKVPRAFLQALEYSGDGLFWIPATGAMCWAPAFTLQDFVKGLLIGFMLDLLFIGSLKALFRRPRPVYNKGMYLVVSLDHYSFPSGHASRAFTILIFVLKYASDWKDTVSQMVGVDELGLIGYYFVPFLFASWAVATASSRIFLGRHFLLDVVVGSLLGILEAWFVINYLLDVRFFLDDQQRRVLEYGQQFKKAMLNFRL